MTKSGWCRDEVQYRHLDNHTYADQLHQDCRFPDTCTCPSHRETT